MAKTLDRDELRSLALVGARTKLQELRAEMAALIAAFPELAGRSAARVVNAAESVTRKVRRRRRRPAMSAEQRKAVSARMKKYWAERRKAKR
jgi:hypothetical protein